MVEQTHVTGYLAEKLGHQLANARTAEERNALAKSILNSEKTGKVMERLNEERVHEKWEGVKQNSELMDKVHISPKAEALYRAHASGMEQAPERLHERAQSQSQPPEAQPVENPGPLGPMSPEV